MKSSAIVAPSLPRGIWLIQGEPRVRIEPLLLQMLERNDLALTLRLSLLEELGRPVKLANVALQYLGLESAGTDREGESSLTIVRPGPRLDAWREALILPGGDCPIGIVINTVDRGPFAFVHEIFLHLPPDQKDLVRRSAARVVEGRTDQEIIAAQVEAAGGEPRFIATLAGARKRVQMLDPSVLFSADGEIRVQIGSLGQTTRNLLREGLQVEHLFLLPSNLFEGGTNFGDIEFLVYLNFFIRHEQRTRLIGTARQVKRLKQLLAISIFGFFGPEDAARPSLVALRERYGVPDQETYDFFLAAYELFAVRESGPGSAILGIKDYVDFIALDAGGASIRLHKEDGRGPFVGEVTVKSRQQGFDVRIKTHEGHVTEKRLTVLPPRRANRPIPAELAAAIRFATERPRFGVTPLGTSHGFDPSGDVTSFVIWVAAKGILVDPSIEALAYLDRIGVAPADVPYVLLTHVHADHDGGLIEKLLGGSRTTVIASDPVFRSFREKASIVTDHDFEAEGLVDHLPANPGRPVKLPIGGGLMTIETRWNLHPIPTNGFRLSFEGKTFGYSGDTKYDRALLDDMHSRGLLTPSQHEDLAYFFWDRRDGSPTVDLLYHEAGVPPIHTDKGQFANFPEQLRSVTSLVHVADHSVPDDFTPGKPRLFGTQVLLPPTDEARREVLLDTLRRVGYLYDIPASTFQRLLRSGKLVSFSGGDTIVERGPVRKGDPLCFYVIADGEVEVMDGLRPLIRLVKGDSFGEWAISHQRGFRVADVTAVRPCQCIRLTEQQYRWLVARHPEVQERITKIRRLLPQLQTAQERCRLKSDPSHPGSRSVIETMTSNQLAGFALFSRVRKFRLGDCVIVEGARADCLYVLLSGHATATVGGREVGELGEGEMFGELGLLEGEARGATVTVVSDDADMLFMSAKSFRRLVDTMPAFAWGIRETASRRRSPVSPSAPRAKRTRP